ncbi:MAG: class I SAM-dependent methyltransferase [Chloroflexi bacterium]|nr:class I SAM-dependent methyltransferase [Chloroflexota bacterium]
MEEHWDTRYREDNIPWNAEQPSQELIRVIHDHKIAPCSVLDIGCGYGTEARFLREQGFQVCAVDISPTAIAIARQRAAEAGATIDFRIADLTAMPDLGGPFDFLFDRGVYHIIRRVDVAAYVALLESVSRPGTLYLTLTGSIRETGEGGPPKLSEAEIRSEMEPLFQILEFREFRWEETPQWTHRPLGWSCLMRRRAV